MTRPLTLVVVSVLTLVVGCAAPPEAEPAATARVAIGVAPLTLAGVTNARYALTVTNAAAGQGDVVWTRTLDATAYGDGAGSLAYVGPCDADVAGGVNTVILDLLALDQVGGEIPADSYDNPTPIAREIVCQANADVAVTFDLTLARRADQGFFDVAVEFEDLFCSAKLDCVDDATGDDLRLLHNPMTGARELTAVLGFACTGGPDTDTYLYMDDVEIHCTGGTGATTLVDVSGLGNLDLDAEPNANPDGYLFAAAVFRGDELLAHKSYWNISFGLDTDAAATESLGTCTLTARATASKTAFPQEDAGFPIAEGAIYPVLAWSVPLTTGGARVCGSHAVNAGDGRVATTYVGYLGAPNQFTWGTEPVHFDHRYHRGGELASKTRSPAVQMPTDGLMLYVDAAVNATGQSLDPTGDMPDVMTATHVDTGVKYWSSRPADGQPGTLLWNADARWQAPSYTLCGWFNKRTDTRQGLWSQYVPTGQRKFNWMADPNGSYHNNMLVSGATTTFSGGPWFALNAWHFHCATYENKGLLRIMVDGQPKPAVVYTYFAGQAPAASSVSLMGRNDDYTPERFDGDVAQAWYYDRVLTDAELTALYASTKARYGVDRAFNPTPTGGTDRLMLHVDAATDPTGRSLDPTGDVPDVMSMTYVDTAPKYWTTNPAGGTGGYMRWNADTRWAPYGSYTIAGWFYRRSDLRQALWSQFMPATDAKFNWMADPGGEYHNNMLASGGIDYNSSTGRWYALNAWHFHALTYVNGGQLKISVDGQPNAVAVATYPTDQSNHATSVSLMSRNDVYELFDGHVAEAWYYARALSDDELAALYAATKARFGVDRVYSHAAP